MTFGSGRSRMTFGIAFLLFLPFRNAIIPKVLRRELTTGEPGSESRSQRFHHLRLSEDWFPKTTPKDSRFLRPLAFEVFGINQASEALWASRMMVESFVLVATRRLEVFILVPGAQIFLQSRN